MNQARVYRCDAVVDFLEDDHPFYPALANEEESFSIWKAAAQDTLGEENVVLADPTMGAEDFSFFLQSVPGAYVFVGMKNETAGAVHRPHTAQFVVNEDVLPLGAALFATVAERCARLKVSKPEVS